MAKKTQNKKDPLPKFHFQVEWGDASMGFTEVSGLDFETEVIEYRQGAEMVYTKSKQPGLKKYGNVTFKRGTFQGDFDFYKWWKQTYLDDYRRDITIKLLDNQHQPVITWQLTNAWPSKLQSTDLKADANEVAIETMEIVHEGLRILEG